MMADRLLTKANIDQKEMNALLTSAANKHQGTEQLNAEEALTKSGAKLVPIYTVTMGPDMASWTNPKGGEELKFEPFGLSEIIDYMQKQPKNLAAVITKRGTTVSLMRIGQEYILYNSHGDNKAAKKVAFAVRYASADVAKKELAEQEPFTYLLDSFSDHDLAKCTFLTRK